MGILIDGLSEWQSQSPQFSELISKSNYSFLRGGSSVESLVRRAIELEMPALGLTDLNGVYALPKAYQAIKEAKEEDPNIHLKLICGAELSIEEKPNLVLLAKDREGYGLLCRLLTESFQGREKAKPLISWKRFQSMCLEEFPKKTQGLICIPKLAFLDEIDQIRDPLIDWVSLKEIFSGRLYLPLSRLLDGRDEWRTDQIQGLSQKWGIPIVATNDVHYDKVDQRKLQDTLTCIREGVSLENAGKRLHSNAERYLKSSIHMRELFSDLPEALKNSMKIVSECDFCLSELKYRYPSEWIPKKHTSQSYLEELVWKGATWRYPEGIPLNVQAQIQHEFRLVSELKYADYFLTIWEIVQFARKKGILCQGRGSAANSALCYCLGITAIDPVRMGLLFERFVSSERGEPPDIDVDFESERREEVIQYIYQKYGRDRAAMVSAVVTYRSKMAKREVNKAFGKEETAELDELQEEVVESLRGFPRHLSIHSGGFTLSADPVVEIVPVEPARMENRTIIQWDKYDLDILGLLKIDVLSLGMLSAIQKCLALLGNRYTFASIPSEDPKTYQMLQRGEAVGLFQVESRAQINMLGRLQPKTFYDLVVEVAIVRPGPIVGQMVHPYLKRRDGREAAVIPHPKLVPILKKTLGVPLFQEQVMQMAIELAGFTPGEADKLRKAMGAWGVKGKVKEMSERLRLGLLRSGLPKEFVDRVFEQIKGFAEYGFPESHAASFALITYASAYLKCHHPAEFTCSVMNSQPMGFYTNYTLINDVKRCGVNVLPIDLHQSVWDSQIEPDPKARSQIRLGFREIKGMSQSEFESISHERSIRRFRSLSDFLSRVSIRSHVLESMAMGDCFRCFGFDQRNALWELIAHQEFLLSQTQSPRQADLFEPLSEYESFQEDYEAFRLSLRGHPMQVFRKKLSKRFEKKHLKTAKEIRSVSNGSYVSVAGMTIVRQRPPTAKGVVFATLEDETGLVDLIFHKAVYDKHRELIQTQGLWIVEGKLQKDRNAVSLLVKRVSPMLPESKQMNIKPKHVYFSY